jgi:hypothetical protein
MKKLAPVNSARAGLRRSGVSWCDHQTNTIWLGEYESDDARNTAARHEMNHFWMHVSTPYGRLLDELTRARNNQVLSYCIHHFKRYPFAQILIPIYQVAKRLRAKRGKLGGVACRDLCERYARPWSHTVFLENVLEGEPFPEVAQAKLATVMHSFQMVEAYLAQMDASPDGGPDVPDEYPAPATRGRGVLDATWPDGSNFPLGAKHVFEGIATQMTLSQPMKKDDMVGGTKPYYWVLWSQWAKETMQAKPIKSKEDYRRFRNTFYALCDLALFVPAGALYGQLRGTDLSWPDIQPGYRFISIVRKASKLGWIEDLDRDMHSYQDEICRLLSWPAPGAFLELGANLQDGDSHSVRHREACQIRLTDHSAFLDFESRVQNGDPAKRFWHVHHPMLYLPHWGELIVRRGETAGDSLSQILDWFFVNFNWSVMRDGEFSYEDFLPEKVSYGETFNNVASRSELIELIHQAVPTLSRQRFQALHLSH